MGRNLKIKYLMLELDRQKKVIDMMITAHSVLRDKYLRLSSIFEISLLIASIVLNALIFVDTNFFKNIFHISAEAQKVIINFATLLVFIISIVLLKVNWREKAANHAQAAEQFFILLQECRGILLLQDDSTRMTTIEGFNKKYSQMSSMLSKIPERKFNSLKLIHVNKIELSKMIDKYPGNMLFILKFKVFINSFREKK